VVAAWVGFLKVKTRDYTTDAHELFQLHELGFSRDGGSHHPDSQFQFRVLYVGTEIASDTACGRDALRI
jgi:hypothetical protein